MEFGRLIKELRISEGLTIKQVATAIEVNVRSYNYYEQSMREPSLETLKKICDFFDVSADYLLGRTDNY
ncbi:MAG: helix-turn-helix domain-containing protein [Clostridiales bacterium]|nr:helix-turn-helix domain-containing protein [Clostridiales bacterium]